MVCLKESSGRRLFFAKPRLYKNITEKNHYSVQLGLHRTVISWHQVVWLFKFLTCSILSGFCFEERLFFCGSEYDFKVHSPTSRDRTGNKRGWS